MGKTIPTLEEVKERFKDAKKVESIYGVKFKLTKIDLERAFIYGDNETVRVRVSKDNWKRIIYDFRTGGYAKILSYKKPKEETFLITKEWILELSKN